jgi:hypothetical protein
MNNRRGFQMPIRINQPGDTAWANSNWEIVLQKAHELVPTWSVPQAIDTATLGEKVNKVDLNFQFIQPNLLTDIREKI